VIKTQHLWRAATSPALTVHTAREETAHTAVFASAMPPLTQRQGIRLPVATTAYEGTGMPAAGFRASGVDVQAQVIRTAVVDRNRLTHVQGVPARGAPV
jgi:hypothetical protein